VDYISFLSTYEASAFLCFSYNSSFYFLSLSFSSLSFKKYIVIRSCKFFSDSKTRLFFSSSDSYQIKIIKFYIYLAYISQILFRRSASITIMRIKVLNKKRYNIVKISFYCFCRIINRKFL